MENNVTEQNEKKILEEEREILREIKQEEKELKKISSNVTKILWVVIAFAVMAIGGFIYFGVTAQRIAIDKSQISAPIIDLAPHTGGVLQSVFVNEGDSVPANTAVAEVGNELIKTKIGGTIISLKNNIGKIFNSGESVVSMIDPTELRVVGQLDEDKGLQDIRVGQRVIFTVDTFGSKEYIGVVDEISQTSRQSDISFSISDKREVKQFDVKVRFDVAGYPELKNGMSARMWIYK